MKRKKIGKRTVANERMLIESLHRIVAEKFTIKINMMGVLLCAKIINKWKNAFCHCPDAVLHDTMLCCAALWSNERTKENEDGENWIWVNSNVFTLTQHSIATRKRIAAPKRNARALVHCDGKPIEMDVVRVSQRSPSNRIRWWYAEQSREYSKVHGQWTTGPFDQLNEVPTRLCAMPDYASTTERKLTISTIATPIAHWTMHMNSNELIFNLLFDI